MRDLSPPARLKVMTQGYDLAFVIPNGVPWWDRL